MAFITLINVEYLGYRDGAYYSVFDATVTTLLNIVTAIIRVEAFLPCLY